MTSVVGIHWYVYFRVLMECFLILPDIDECMNSSYRCEGGCENTVGSFVCNCSTGFLLDSDGLSCVGELTLVQK